jgi:hypothetical protein
MSENQKSRRDAPPKVSSEIIKRIFKQTSLRMRYLRAVLDMAAAGEPVSYTDADVRDIYESGLRELEKALHEPPTQTSK